MNQQRSTFFGVLVVMAMTFGCGGPTDSDIDTRVETKLTADETVKAAQINVGVQKKVVTLSGTVDTPAVRDQAVAMARATEGVTDVVDHMTMRQQGVGPGPGHAGEMMDKGAMKGMVHMGQPAVKVAGQ